MPFEEKLYPSDRVTYTACTPTKSTGTTNSSAQTTLPDHLLWETFKSGDELAFITIYKNYCNTLFNFGCQFTTDRELVKDCLQDFFIYLRKNKTGFGETNSIKLYLLKSFKRRVIDYLKKNNVELCSNETFAFLPFPVELSFESTYISQEVKLEQVQKLNKGLKALDAKEREAIYYFYYEGLSYEQIAGILNFSHVSSARRIMYRGLRHLRSFF